MKDLNIGAVEEVANLKMRSPTIYKSDRAILNGKVRRFERAHDVNQLQM